MSGKTDSSSYERNVFVLDISGSMGGMKCQTLQLAVRRIVDDIPEQSYAGIVLFDTRVELCHKLTQITSRPIRDGIKESVPAMARGGTDIGAGIMKGVSCFKEEGISTDGATMYLVTDGQDGRNYVDAVLPTLLESKIRVFCIAIGNSADDNLERLSRETSGKTSVASDTNPEQAARVIEATIQEARISTALAEAMDISVFDESLVLTSLSLTKNVTIDPDIGQNTVFTIGSVDFEKMSVLIQSPNGKAYDSSSSPEFTRNQMLKRYQLSLDLTEPGVWSLTIKKESNQTITANVSVKSQPLNSDYIQLNIELKEADSESPPIIIAQLRKGIENVVIGATLTATVDRPNGTQTKLKLNNYNNIYCNYFTDYCGSGRYNVTVLAVSNKCQLKSLTSKTIVNESVPQFKRQQIAGCFKISVSMPARPDDKNLEELALSVFEL